MYNNITEQKIKEIPPIGDIDIDRLPQELTRIYAQIVSLRRQVVDGVINFLDENLISNVYQLRKLANNLETILLTSPNHEQKESIAFVAATANSLIHKMGLINKESQTLLEIDAISSYLITAVLFLIGNSQADAAEAALSIKETETENIIQQRLVSCIISLATGKLSQFENSNFNEKEVLHEEDYQQIALNYLWREIGLGSLNIAKRLLNTSIQAENHFEKVIELSISEAGIFNQKNVFSGPYRLAKLLNVLEKDIFDKAVINIPLPENVNPNLWQPFLEKLAKSRPYLWENHKEAINTRFLNPGISAVLTLPTGAGKSTLSELKIASCLYSEKKVVYIVPTHALEDQINENLRLLFSEFENINIDFDGEYTEFEELGAFPILVMTPERCLTYLNINSNYFNDVGLVVFDEFHLIHGTDIKKDRRSIDAMYCLLSLFTISPHADYFLISAMVENGEEIASWISQVTNRDCKLFNSTWKPTRQLHGCLVYEENKLNELVNQIRTSKNVGKTKNPSTTLKGSMTITPYCFFSLKNIWETVEMRDYYKTQILDREVRLAISNQWKLTSNRNSIAAELAIHFSKLNFKTLVFVDSPGTASSTSKNIAESLDYNKSNYTEFLNQNKETIKSLCLELGNIENSYFHNSENVGVHHGLLLPIERGLIENYFKNPNGSTVLVATATLAQGINIPAEIVIIAGDDRFDEDTGFREQVNPHELLNAAGRAGRAGLSSQGAVLLIPGEIVSINDSTISDRWWQLKNNVFSKGDQCLKVEDPLEYFLDSLQDDSELMSTEQINVLYRFKPEKLSEKEAKNLLNKSFYAYKAQNVGDTEQFEHQVRRLLDRRNELDNLPEEYLWQKEIGIKTGIEPSVICDLDNTLEEIGIENFIIKSIPEIIDWFFIWICSDERFIGNIFTKQSTIDQIKKAIGLKSEAQMSDILLNLNVLSDILKMYIQGMPLNELNAKIPDVNRVDKSPYLIKSRNFVNRLVPELSFGFGLLSMIIIEKAKQKNIDKNNIPMDIRVLASCIREGVDSSEKLFFKKNNNLLMRVETHLKFSRN